MPGLFDKIAKVAQQTASAAQEKATEGKIRLEIRAFEGKLDEQAQLLGRLMYRQHKGETIPDEEHAKILGEMEKIEAERKAKEAELDELLRPGAHATAQAPGAQPGVTCSCGAALAAGTKFCPQCGAPQS